MSERLEDFIKKNRKQFDEFNPPADLWEKIDQQLTTHEKSQGLSKERVVKLSVILKIAATLVVIFIGGTIFWQHQQKAASDISNISPQLAKQEFHYATLIQEKRKELKQIEKEEPDLYREFSSEIREINNNYQKLKQDLSTSPNQEETVKAMIRNLQIQIQVLNQQLQIIEQVNQLKKGQKNETQGI